MRCQSRVTSLVVAFCFAVTPLLQTINLAAQAKPAPKAATTEVAATDPGWPHVRHPGQGHVTVYEPQISSWATKTDGCLRGGVICRSERIRDFEAGARHDQDRSANARLARRASRELRQHANLRPTSRACRERACSRPSPKYRGHSKPNASSHSIRCSPSSTRAIAEGRFRDEERSAEDFLQPGSRAARQLRRRADLESDREE